MNNLLEKVNFGGRIFISSTKAQMLNEGTITMAVMIGFMQGLKYNGNLNRGLKSGITTLVVLGMVNGVRNVVENWDTIKNQ